jgi:O-antigen ligase
MDAACWRSRGLIAASLAALFACAAVAPPLFWLLLAGMLAAGVALLVFRHAPVASAVWLLLAGATLEMTLCDLIGPEAFQPTIALVKGAGLVLAAITVLRYGPTRDPFNPGIAFVVIFLTGLAHGLHPALTPSDSLRSLIGSCAPYAFSFSRLSRGWAQVMIRMTTWIPAITVTAAAALDLAGLRSMFVDSGGMRLAGLGHPAFLAGICLAGIYACLIELYRGRPVLWLLVANGAILVLTGARAPAAYAAAVMVVTLACVDSPHFPRRRRMRLLLFGALASVVLAVLAGSLSDLRLFALLGGEAANLSGREQLWPSFAAAAESSPWVGWGVGAGNAIIPPDSLVAKQMHTWAAHNEYLRMAVEGGELGRGLLILMFTLWAWTHTARLRPSERRIMRFVFIAFACHAITDNVLISTSASVLFAFVAAVFARGALEAEAAPSRMPRLLGAGQVA